MIIPLTVRKKQNSLNTSKRKQLPDMIYQNMDWPQLNSRWQQRVKKKTHIQYRDRLQQDWGSEVILPVKTLLDL